MVLIFTWKYATRESVLTSMRAFVENFNGGGVLTVVDCLFSHSDTANFEGTNPTI